MDLLSLLAWVSIIFAFSFIILFATITYISNRISLLGIYHKLKSSENPNGEEFLNKVVEVSKCNFLLAFPMGFAFYIIIIQNIPNSDSQAALLVAIGLSLVTLIMIRVLANPCGFIKPLICSRDGGRTDDHLKFHKERVLSFFFALIEGSIIVVLGLFSYNLLKTQNFTVPTFSLVDFGEVFIIYVALVVGVTLLGEGYLLIFKPLKQI